MLTSLASCSPDTGVNVYPVVTDLQLYDFNFGQLVVHLWHSLFVSQRAINGKINFLWIFPYYIWITAFEISYSYFVYVKTDTRHGHETSLPFHGAQSVKSKFVSYIIIYKILPLIHKKQLFIKYPIILGVCVCGSPWYWIFSVPAANCIFAYLWWVSPPSHLYKQVRLLSAGNKFMLTSSSSRTFFIKLIIISSLTKYYCNRRYYHC